MIVCTYKHENRMRDLLDLIRSLTVVSNSQYIYEILVIDNGESLAKEADYLKLFDYREVKIINEFRVGLSYARNTGIANASAEIIAFLDDDVVVSSSWAESALSGHVRDGVLCVGGPVMTRNPALKYPDWFSNYFLRFFVPPSFPPVAGEIHPPFYLIGANMSFKKSAFWNFGLFNTNLGRKGASLLSGEDTEFIMRLPTKSVYFHPKMTVLTDLEQEKITRRFFLKRIFWQAVSDARIVGKHDDDSLYDNKELSFSSLFFGNLFSLLWRMDFFQISCILLRIFTFKVSLALKS